MKKLILGIITLLVFSCENSNKTKAVESIHHFNVQSLEGDTINFADFKGKKILIVNTASECGFTSQYSELQELYKNYDEKLVVVGFPANNFGGQEPGDDEDIKTFCEKNYGVTFPMASKVSVKGDNTAPIFEWLTNKSQNGVMDAEIKWNFNKFLLNEEGQLIEKFESNVTPMSEDIVKYL